MIHEPSSEGFFIAGTLHLFQRHAGSPLRAGRLTASPTSHPRPLPRPGNINRPTFIPYARVNAGRFQRPARIACRYTSHYKGKSDEAS